MKILYWNLYEGCKEKTRLDSIARYIKRMNVDILGLSELNGWDSHNFSKLEYFKKASGFSFHSFAKASSGYNVGLFSKYKPNTTKIITKNFNTGMIKSDFSGKNRAVSAIVTHLHHINEDARLKELNIIFRHLNKNTPAVLMGDLNSLSPLDEYRENRLLKQLKKMRLEKFGTSSLRKDVISSLMEFGLLDAVKKFSRKNEYSVPTLYNRDPKHFNKLRLDYIFMTKKITHYAHKALILRNKATTLLSDHFPVMAEIDWPEIN